MTSEDSMFCPSVQEILGSYLDGECSYLEYSQVLLHLPKCSLCSEHLRQTNLLVQQLSNLPELKITCNLTKNNWQSIIDQECKPSRSTNSELGSLRNQQQFAQPNIIFTANFIIHHLAQYALFAAPVLVLLVTIALLCITRPL